MSSIFFSPSSSRNLHIVALRITQLGRFHLTPQWRISVLSSQSVLTEKRQIHSNAPRRPSNTLGRLENATCMVTGASSGIGFAIAQRMLLEGAGKVILVGRNSEHLQNALQRLEEAVPPKPMLEEPQTAAEAASRKETKDEADSVTKPSKWGNFSLKPKQLPPSAMVTVTDRISFMIGDVGSPSFWSGEMKKAMSDVDILVNAAGVSHSSLLPFAKDEAISEMLNTNLQGTIFACRAMTSRLLRRPTSSHSDISKCIINISSLHALKGGIGAATYASTKAGVIALTRAIAAEASTSRQGPKLRANVIVPGYIKTKMLDEIQN
ncbi:predicted protein [Uncinocarpus reesii 1704]|uniref:3-oxoacyl-[acyl-carrier-protein] reductase n=1 Tax=Uncinocarpus reesii (strain UAMH 1704) TaxID=336963 RepID=C4JQ86_UNCRE|nr:uncharacterized protein UREG_04640 [Uncinocarpus reesii 1704]EEP79794.1 predicted protein [Uncinocarpus reesii 1704]